MTGSIRTIGKANRNETRCPFLDLPGEILSQIATYLPFHEVIPFLSLHSTLLSLTKSNLSPFPHLIHTTLNNGPPYPKILAKLPSLHLFLPPDRGRLFIPILSRARPKWILERLELGAWSESIWEEAFETRFLPSWKRFKNDDDTWRAVFLRLLGRLEHRGLGCTHEESWTRFLTLSRNGSGSINRIYSRLFDPFEIYDELKHQNNFSNQPTQVRVLLHLQDVRIIALGVLHDRPSLFINPNAHLLLHPPLLRDYLPSPTEPEPEQPVKRNKTKLRYDDPPKIPTREARDPFFPLSRTLSTSGPSSSSASGLGESPGSGGGGSSLRNTFAKVLPGRNNRIPRPTSREREGGGIMLVRVNSRDGSLARVKSHDEVRKNRFGFGRRNTSSGPGVVTFERPELGRSRTEAKVAFPSGLGRSDSPPPLVSPIDPIPAAAPEIRTRRLPYRPLRKPLPVRSYRLYPNHTPTSTETETDEDGGQVSDPTEGVMKDTRGEHLEEEDDTRFFGGGDLPGSGTGMGGGEDGRWCEVEGEVRRRWVGPMILIAQLHPSDRTLPAPPGTNPALPIEGSAVDLGPKGMYVSMGFEDLQVIAPWLELVGGGGNGGEERRAGLGFDVVD